MTPEQRANADKQVEQLRAMLERQAKDPSLDKAQKMTETLKLALLPNLRIWENTVIEAGCDPNEMLDAVVQTFMGALTAIVGDICEQVDPKPDFGQVMQEVAENMGQVLTQHAQAYADMIDQKEAGNDPAALPEAVKSKLN